MIRVLKSRPIRKKEVCDIIYKLYCVTGGFYYSEQVTPFIRYAWIVLNVTGVTFIVLLGTIGYLLTSRNLSTLNTVYVMWQLNAVSYTFVFTPSLTFRFRHVLEKLIDSIDNNFHCQAVFAAEKEKYDTKRRVANIIFLQTVLLVPFVTLNIFDMVLGYRIDKIHDVYHYLYPFPFIENFSSVFAYAIIYAIQLIFAIVMCTVGAVFPAFIVALGCEFYNTYADMCARLRKISTEMMDNFEKHFDQPTSINPRRMKKLSESFREKFVEIIKEYGKISSIQAIRPFIEIYYSVLIVCFFTAQLANVYIVLVTDIDVTMKIKQLLMLAATNTIFFAYCVLGKLFEDMNESIVSAVYSTPWYYLQPECRKIIYIFLCRVQKPTRFFAFRVYPVTMATFPRVMNVVYSYINLFRTSLHSTHVHERS